MSDSEKTIRALAALGQCVPMHERDKLFGMLTTWLVSEKSGADVETSSYFDSQNKDTKQAIKVVKSALTQIDHSIALNLLANSSAFSGAINSIMAEQQQFEERVDYVTTQPNFVRQIEGAAASAPIWGGTLLDAIRGLVLSADETVDIINPYWSKLAAGELLSGFEKANVEFRVLTVVGNAGNDANRAALDLFAKRIESAGSRLTVYSPTEEQIQATDALAPIHAKVFIQDRLRAYVGSANLSKGGLSTGLEIGLIHSGPTVSRLVQYCDWLFGICEAVEA